MPCGRAQSGGVKGTRARKALRLFASATDLKIRRRYERVATAVGKLLLYPAAFSGVLRFRENVRQTDSQRQIAFDRKSLILRLFLVQRKPKISRRELSAGAETTYKEEKTTISFFTDNGLPKHTVPFHLTAPCLLYLL